MKKNLLLLAIFSLLVAGCKKEKEPEDYQQVKRRFLEQLTSQLIGTWNYQRIDISAIKYEANQQKAGITKDTIITNLATLTIKRCEDQASTNYPICECILTYKNRQISAQFGLIGYPPTNNSSNDYFASFLFETVPFPYPWEKPEDAFLQYSYIAGENYEIIQLDAQRMTWKGQNASATGVNRIEFVKLPQ